VSGRTRQQVEAKLRHPVRDNVWSVLDELGLVSEAEDSDDLTELIRFARQLTTGRTGKPRIGRHDLPPVEAGGTVIVSRARAFSELLVEDAAKDGRVASYRRRFIGGQSIAFAAVERLLASPAACLVPAGMFELAKIPLLGHDSQIVGEQRAGCGGAWPDCYRFRIEFAVRFAGAETILTVEDSPSRRRFLVYQSSDRQELVAAVANESPLAHLLDLAESLGGEYRWRASEAAAYVLEGIVPSVRLLEVATSFHVAPSLRGQATINLAVDPAVPMGEVARAYRQAQLAVLPSPARVPNERTMAAIVFVSQRRREEPTVPWRELMEAFNRDTRKPFLAVSAFIQTVNRGREELRPEVTLPSRLKYWLPRLRRRGPQEA
jgi:hypothetical protein